MHLPDASATRRIDLEALIPVVIGHVVGLTGSAAAVLSELTRVRHHSLTLEPCRTRTSQLSTKNDGRDATGHQPSGAASYQRGSGRRYVR